MNTQHERHPEQYRDEWLTPRSILSPLGEFDLDPCSPINRPWPTAKHHYTILDDGLMQDWFGRVWCNPPYSIVGEFMRKLAAHGNGIALTFARTDTEMFHRYVWNKAGSILFIRKRIRFCDITGKPGNAAGAPSVLIAYGEQNVSILENSTIPGQHLHINYSKFIIVGISPTWLEVVKIAIRNTGSATDLAPIYEAVERMAGDKIANNQHWKAKIRQQVQVIRKRNINLFE